MYMSVNAVVKEVKVAMKFAKGSQTIGKCNQEATHEELFTFGQAVGSLNQEAIESITKVEETALIKA